MISRAACFKELAEPLAKKSHRSRCGGEDESQASRTRSSLELGAESEKRIRQLGLAPLPDGDAFHFHTREKARYVKNMHSLIVTARAEINTLKSQIDRLNTRQVLAHIMHIKSIVNASDWSRTALCRVPTANTRCSILTHTYSHFPCDIAAL